MTDPIASRPRSPVALITAQAGRLSSPEYFGIGGETTVAPHWGKIARPNDCAPTITNNQAVKLWSQKAFYPKTFLSLSNLRASSMINPARDVKRILSCARRPLETIRQAH